MKKILTAIMLATLSSSAITAETIRFGTQATYPPFEFIDANNQIQGFDIDLVKALCKEIQATCTFTNQSFDSLIPSLKFKRIDAAIAGMDITAERNKQVDFSQPYYENSALFIVQKDRITDITALKSKRIGVQNGTTHQKFLVEKHPEMILVAYDNYQNAILDLKNGRLDAVFGDTAVVREWLQENAQLTTIGREITDPNYFGAGLAIAVRKNNTKLLKQFDLALTKIKQDSTYQTLYQKWFKQ